MSWVQNKFSVVSHTQTHIYISQRLIRDNLQVLLLEKSKFFFWNSDLKMYKFTLYLNYLNDSSLIGYTYMCIDLIFNMGPNLFMKARSR